MKEILVSEGTRRDLEQVVSGERRLIIFTRGKGFKGFRVTAKGVASDPEGIDSLCAFAEIEPDHLHRVYIEDGVSWETRMQNATNLIPFPIVVWIEINGWYENLMEHTFRKQ